MICDGQRVTVFFVAEQELTFVVGAPQLVGLLPQRQGRALRMIASAPSALDQAVAIEHGVDGAARRNLHGALGPSQKVLPREVSVDLHAGGWSKMESQK